MDSVGGVLYAVGYFDSPLLKFSPSQNSLTMSVPNTALKFVNSFSSVQQNADAYDAYVVALNSTTGTLPFAKKLYPTQMIQRITHSPVQVSG